MDDTLEAIVEECEGVFRFNHDSRPQDRAHDYLREHRVERGFDDTAMQCAAVDMVRRAYAVGLAENGRTVARETARIIADGIKGALDD